MKTLVVYYSRKGYVEKIADAKIKAENVEGIENAKIIVEGHAMADSINEMINR